MNKEQFNPPYSIPKEVINVYQMGNIFTGEVWIGNTKHTISSTDWVCKDDDGNITIIKDKDKYNGK